jgi:hypothetical protein
MLIVLAGIIVNLNNYAQPYKSVFGNGLAKWSISVENEYPLSDEWQTYGDTIINQLNYKKVYGLNGFIPCTTSIPVNEQWRTFISFSSFDKCFPIYLRESDNNSKIYFYDSQTNKESLVADFSLQKGDTFYLPKNVNLSPFINSSNTPYDIVDSIYYKDGLKYIQFGLIQLKLYNINQKFTFIEGVGTNAGVMYVWENHPFAGWGAMLNCFSNNSIFYKNESVNFSCGYVGFDNIANNQYVDYKINYINNKIIISFEESGNRIIELFDCQGKLHLHETNQFSHSFEINKYELSKGLYLLKITNQSSYSFHTIKILI